MHTRIAVLLFVAGVLPWTAISMAQEKASPAAQAAGAAAKKAVRPIAATKAFLATLGAEQKAKAMLDYDSDQRLAWHFIPMETRKGLPMMEMNAEQQAAAKALLRATVSQLGYDKATMIMQLERVLLELEGPKSQGRRDPQKYYFTVFGKPALKQAWGLSVEGHHLSLNFSMQGNEIVDSTPQFLGANPAELKESYGDQLVKGLSVLSNEEQLGFKLVNSLDEGQLAKATLPGDVPQDIRGAGEPQPPTDPARGIAAKDMTPEQQATLKLLIESYSSKMKTAVAKQRWKLINDGGFENIKFAWSGAKKAGAGHYYVVQGSTFVIEFINVQPDPAGNPANHIHCVWRDLQGDFNLAIGR